MCEIHDDQLYSNTLIVLAFREKYCFLSVVNGNRNFLWSLIKTRIHLYSTANGYVMRKGVVKDLRTQIHKNYHTIM